MLNIKVLNNISPLGLEALDMVRIEAGLIFYGYEFDDKTDPFEAGIGFTVPLKTKEDDFIGKEALREIKLKGPKKKLMGVEIQGEPITIFNEEHWPVLSDGKIVGSMNALVYSPRLDKNIGYTILDIEYAKSGKEIIISSPEKELMATTVDIPWLK